MNKNVKCIMLVDDDSNDNYFHEREIKRNNSETIIITKYSGKESLKYLESEQKDNEIRPDLIFLDINMPGMDGWEFLKEYNRLDKKLQSRAIIIMLSSSANRDEIESVMTNSIVSDYIIKPLTKETLEDIIKKHL
jgi:CheY-like chemotaxis protein